MVKNSKIYIMMYEGRHVSATKSKRQHKANKSESRTEQPRSSKLSVTICYESCYLARRRRDRFKGRLSPLWHWNTGMVLQTVFVTLRGIFETLGTVWTFVRLQLSTDLQVSMTIFIDNKSRTNCRALM